jgi:hypothetical protein
MGHGVWALSKINGPLREAGKKQSRRALRAALEQMQRLA